LKQHYFVVVLAHSLHGRLRRIHIPHQALYVLLGLALFGSFSLFGMVSSYLRMTWKVANYNTLRSEVDTLRHQYKALQQENDQNQAQLTSLNANVQALEKAIAAQRSNVAAAQANLARLQDVQGYRIVKAPFDGVITVRNVDVGALVTSGSTLLYRIAQTGTLRTYVNVPQVNASAIHTGQAARLTLSNFPGRHFPGSVARTANALDPATRTMLVEIAVPNADGALFPGMYAEVDLSIARANPPLLIPAQALLSRSDGAQVAVVQKDGVVHLQKVSIGRDFGDRVEIVQGVAEGTTILVAPGDAAEGAKIVPLSSGTAQP